MFTIFPVRERAPPTSCACPAPAPVAVPSVPPVLQSSENMFATFLSPAAARVAALLPAASPPVPLPPGLLSMHNRSFRRTFWSLGICFRVAVAVVFSSSSALWCCLLLQPWDYFILWCFLLAWLTLPGWLYGWLTGRILETSYSCCRLLHSLSCTALAFWPWFIWKRVWKLWRCFSFRHFFYVFFSIFFGLFHCSSDAWKRKFIFLFKLPQIRMLFIALSFVWRYSCGQRCSMLRVGVTRRQFGGLLVVTETGALDHLTGPPKMCWESVGPIISGIFFHSFKTHQHIN